MIAGVFRVWLRNWEVHKATWKINFLVPLLEPIFYLVAFGVGLNALVGEVNLYGQKVSYFTFVATAILGINIMNYAFFENTYSSFVRMYYQKTFDAMIATPLTPEEIITGEIVWGATKSLMATVVVMFVLSLFDLIRYPHGLMVIPLAVIGGLAFGSIGMFFTAFVRHIDSFNLPYFLFITPMYLFSGTFFPLDVLPLWMQILAFFLPLTHLVNMIREFCYGSLGSGVLLGIGYFSLCILVFYAFALRKMKNRLLR
ncbi:MAG: ABC transporter permease [Syntrophales bacterium]|nr:ABC transporter permease [Syntrophales bacterium]